MHKILIQLLLMKKNLIKYNHGNKFTISSTSQWNNSNSNYLFHTEKEKAWCVFDLLNTIIIKRLVLINRKDGCKERISPSIITIIDENNNNVWSYQINEVKNDYSWDMNVKGKYVRIDLINPNYLHIAGLDVYTLM